MAENGNMWKFGPNNPHGTTFAPKQWLYQRKATGMESSKMYCHSRCRNSTYQCWAANYPVSWGAVYGQEWKYAKLRAYLSAWYRVSTRGMFIWKGSYGYGELKNVLLKSLEKLHLPVWVCKLPRFMNGSIGPWMEICENSGMPIPMVPRLYQRNGYITIKLRVWRVYKTCCPRRCRNSTNQGEAANYPVSWVAV